ncbi:hypothetical protein AVEN_125957-1 [Araneus ventricosus]|uniref:Uncharacterized protein n=1 Tax=Araneus ventricosus TaxID=182803 RepID=A0A4Y2GTK8_ARAVE|nr:hypothetical protein AVEN_125957-1 [Araneus ventricosus]
MKSFDFKFERKQETVDEKVENVILIEEPEDEDFGSFQQEMEAAKMDELIYLESPMVDFSTNLFVDNVCSITLEVPEWRHIIHTSAGFKKLTVVNMI